VSWEKIELYGKTASGNHHFDKKLLEEWLEGKGIVTWTGASHGYNVPQTLKTGRSTIGNPNHITNTPPHSSKHAAFFKATNPLKLWFVYHPYDEIKSIKKDIEEWALKNDLEVRFYDENESWFWKGKSTTIVITTK